MAIYSDFDTKKDIILLLVVNKCDIKQALGYWKIIEKELNISIYIEIAKRISNDSTCLISEIFADLLKAKDMLLVGESALNWTKIEEGLKIIETEWVNRNCCAPAA